MTNTPFWLADNVGDGQFTYVPPPAACVGAADHQSYMGGVAMATHIEALERHFERPLYWATTHFLNHGLLGEDMELRVEAISGGRSVVQAMAEMRRGDTVLHRTIAALGARDGEPDPVRLVHAALEHYPAGGRRGDVLRHQLAPLDGGVHHRPPHHARHRDVRQVVGQDQQADLPARLHDVQAVRLPPQVAWGEAGRV